MGGNKFATVLHRNAHRLAVVLVYALLEWILIILLLLNSSFSYLIRKFADYFGLKPPCLWCSRVDHILEPGKPATPYKDLFCDTHAMEISKLGYCKNHQKLAECNLLCEECLASDKHAHTKKFTEITNRSGFISWLCKGELDDNEDGETEPLSCSCCNKRLSRQCKPHCLLNKPSWWGSDFAQRETLITEAIDEDVNDSYYMQPCPPNSPAYRDMDTVEVGTCNEEAAEEETAGCSSNFWCHEKEMHDETKHDSIWIAGREQISCGVDVMHQYAFTEEDLIDVINIYPQEYESDRLIPVELIDLTTTANRGSSSSGKQGHQNADVDSPSLPETRALVFTEAENGKMIDHEKVENLETFKSNAVDIVHEQVVGMKGDIDRFCTEVTTKEPNFFPVTEIAPSEEEEEDDCFELMDKEIETRLLKKEGPRIESNVSYVQDYDLTFPYIEEDQSPSTEIVARPVNSSATETTENEPGSNQTENSNAEHQVISDHHNQQEPCNQSMNLDPSEAEENKLPETPTSVEAKVLVFGKKEPIADDSVDGSVLSEMEISDPAGTIEQLKTALKTERRALSALYAELDEERSASAIAANQTMAMITRLQEEKAAMQMEAVQYQRMMEEQAEYDQEALQLLNELMLKREKEKQELERELETYHQKVLDYETIDKIKMIRRSNDGSVQGGNPSASCTSLEDADELSIDLNCEPKDEENSCCRQLGNSFDNVAADEALDLEEMAMDCVKHISALDVSLTEFEEERSSILDQLKSLEEKLLTLGDDEFTEDMKTIVLSSGYAVNGAYEESDDLGSSGQNDLTNELSVYRSQGERITMASMAKSLLPLMDATDNDTEEQVADETQEPKSLGIQSSLDCKKVAIEEQVDRVYERLKALEEKEFIKDCAGSINKGNRGMNLLQEILQDLCDLRAVELRSKSINDQ